MRMVYIDESGDHGPRNDEYPIFVIVACVFESEDYVDHFVPALLRLKLKHWGHELAILHEREIRKPQGDFNFLLNPNKRAAFLTDLSRLVRESKARVHAVVWDKRIHANRFSYGECLRRLIDELSHDHGDSNATAPIIVESRGAEENRRTLHALGEIKTCMAQMVRFTEKAANVPGLQLADLCARPIGIKILRPDAKNRAFDESVSLLMQARDSAMPASGAIITL
jgi:hypothetical protein